MVMGVLEVFALVLSSPKYCISDSFVDHDGYFISSEGFLIRLFVPLSPDRDVLLVSDPRL